MQFKRRQVVLRSRLELTPLIDVLLILNIFFLLNTRFHESTGLDLVLPKASTSAATKTKTVEISVDKNNRIHFEGNEIDLKTLEERLIRLSRKTPMLLKADRGASYGIAVEIFDLLRKYHYKQVTLASLPKRKEK